MAYNTSIKEAAIRLGISVQAVHKRISNGTLRAQKVNKRWLVSDESLAENESAPLKPGRPRKGETYLLMNGTYEVMEFSFDRQRLSFIPRSVIDPTRAPIGTVTRAGVGSASGLARWWQHRSIPGGRSALDRKLAELGLDDPMLLPFRSLGFSLSDQYWIQPSGENLKWDDLNYFDNDFGNESEQWDDWLADVGLSSPDNTSEGALPKKWVCEGSRRTLLKGHVPWTDQQVYNEVVASALHRRVLDPREFVPYEARIVEGLGTVAACPCFVRSDEEYVPASLVYETEGARRGESVFDALLRQATNLGITRDDAASALCRMIVCDGLLANTDRHLRNFGFIRNINTLEWRFAPLFDSGNSLWYDKDEGQVAASDYSFIARPFDASPNRQLILAANNSWFELDLLDGFEDEASEILENGNLSRWRLDYLKKGIRNRIEALRIIWG